MIDDPAVRSVRVAVALCDRLGDLLKGPDFVTARKQNSALLGVSGNEEALSLRIGEVQQIYPEIWRHLDDARAAFAGRGIDVSAYDAIRAAEGTALGAKPDFDRSQHGAGEYGYAQTTKSANFNRAGAKRAVAAYRALMVATPQIDWEAIAKAEANDPNIAAFTRSTTTRRYIMFGLLAALIASPFVYVWNTKRQERARSEARAAKYERAADLSAADRAKLENKVAKARARVSPASAAWSAAFQPDALAALKPSTKPCAYAFPAPTPATADKFVKYASVEAGYGPEFASYSPGAVIPNLVGAATRRLDALERGLARGDTTAADIERTLKDLPSHILVVVIDKETAPVPREGTTFTSGALAARAFVYSIADAKIACTATVEVANTPGVATPPEDRQARDTLYRDLEVQLRRGIAANLRAI